ncbi:MAG: SCO family protein [Halofilum sp. (in: g-proteobacteria)]|nr:SCO family protein [Halofilum sp. (in: g-proteobacteria)]
MNLLFFGYTSCPDVCPMTLSRLSRVLDRLEPDERRQIRVLFVSVDPRRDPPARLREYTNAFGPRFVGLTADVSRLEKLTSRYYTTFSYGEPDAAGNYDVRHNAARSSSSTARATRGSSSRPARLGASRAIRSMRSSPICAR